jgi:serine/threonine protein kinase
MARGPTGGDVTSGDVASGDVVAHRYRLERKLGAGGTATVWLAHDIPGDRDCALKLLDRDGDAAHPGAAEARRDRLRREARLLATLDHPNVVRVWDVGDFTGVDGQQRAFIVMEYVTGGSLADLVRRHGAMRPHDAVGLVLGLLAALEAAHAIGVVHRDVKPGNVLLRAEGSPALCDFGIARDDQESSTRTGVALGSMGYMAPEQRIDARSAGPGADLYAVACTLFNLVTADTPVDLYLAHDSSPRWDAVPPPLRPILRRATRSEPSARPLTATELADELRAVRPLLESLAPARPRLSELPAGYVPTAVDEPRTAPPEPSLRAEQRERFLTRDEWRWAENTRRSRVGSQAVWVSAMLVALALLAALNVDRFVALVEPTPVPAPAPPPDVAGAWVGAMDGWPARLDLAATPGAIEGHLHVDLDAGALDARVTGTVDATGVHLVEAGPRAVRWDAAFGRSTSVLEGTVALPAGPASFAFVRVSRGTAGGPGR